MNSQQDHALTVTNLEVEFDTYGGTVHAVRDVSFGLRRGKTLAIVGESGCGKSVTVQALMGLIPMPPGRITRGSATLRSAGGGDTELIGLGERELNRIRGNRIGMIFQDPMSSLNPTMRIGDQIVETLRVHRGMSIREGFKEAERLLDRVRIAEARERARQYPFELSGGMLQRVMIAVALACSPEILIADEPTTALDVTIQAQILDLMQALQREENMSIILITHDLGVVARMADDVAVMYAGQIVESGSAEAIFHHGGHPYTLGLRRATPSNVPGHVQQLEPIEGSPPDLFQPPPGCGYFARCPHAMQVCEQRMPAPFDLGVASSTAADIRHSARCWLQHEQAPRREGIRQRGREQEPS